MAVCERTLSNTARIHLAHHGRGSRGRMRRRMCPHLPRIVSRKGRRGGPHHRTSPQGRLWPRGDAVFQVFLDVFQACCNSMFRVFQKFHLNVARVPFGCCKSRSRCCIYCNSCTCMLQLSISKVLSIFCTSTFASVSNACLKCFI